MTLGVDDTESEAGFTGPVSVASVRLQTVGLRETAKNF